MICIPRPHSVAEALLVRPCCRHRPWASSGLRWSLLWRGRSSMGRMDRAPSRCTRRSGSHARGAAGSCARGRWLRLQGPPLGPRVRKARTKAEITGRVWALRSASDDSVLQIHTYSGNLPRCRKSVLSHRLFEFSWSARRPPNTVSGRQSLSQLGCRAKGERY